MYRTISLVLVLFLLIGLCGCGEAPVAGSFTTAPVNTIDISTAGPNGTGAANTDGLESTNPSETESPDTTEPEGTATAQPEDTQTPEDTDTEEATATPKPTTPPNEGVLSVDPVIGKPNVSEYLTLRKTASTTSESLAQIPKDGEFTVVMVETGKKWLKVEYDGKTGFVPFKYVSVGSEDGDLVCTVFCDSVLNVRDGAGTGHDVIGSVEYGTNLIVKSKATSGGKTWYKVEIGSTVGYVSAQYCRLSQK